MRAILLVVVAAVGMAAPAMAQPLRTAIGGAERAATVTPANGGAAIELANAYWRAGRAADATIAYRRALALDNVMMETRLGDPIWSHEVARRQLATAALSAR